MALKKLSNEINSQNTKPHETKRYRPLRKKPTALKTRRRIDFRNDSYEESTMYNTMVAMFYPTPIALTEWSPIISCPIYTVPSIPVVVNSTLLSTPYFPYAPPILTSPLVAPVATPPILTINDSPLPKYEIESLNCSELDTTAELTIEDIEASPTIDELEKYINLPKSIFPPARTFTMDPNAMIEAFCRFEGLLGNLPWILDLEFGVPRSPITRPIPIYNVKLNSINCKNTPDAIHPGFESCDEDFKRVLLFYYDVVISGWYRGYVLLNNDSSVDNFQSWLLLPMQALGMCWA